MSEVKEHYDDDSMPLLKGMIEVNKAKTYFELARINRGALVTSMFNKYIHRLQFIIDHVSSHQNEESRKIFNEAVLEADTFKYDDVLDALIDMDEDQVNLARKTIMAIKNKELIEFVPEKETL